MAQYYEYELGKAAKILCEELFKLKPGETFVITADTESDERVVEATASAAFACGAKPMVITVASPLGVGKAADPMLPLEALTAALLKADAWVEFNNEWLLYSTPYDIAVKENKKLRHECLVGMSVEMMVRNMGRVDYPNLEKFMKLVTQKTMAAKHMRITTPAGTDVEFDNEPGRKQIMELGYADTPGSHMMAEQLGWSPTFDSINEKIFFDDLSVNGLEGWSPADLSGHHVGTRSVSITNIHSWLATRFVIELHVCASGSSNAHMLGGHSLLGNQLHKLLEIRVVYPSHVADHHLHTHSY